jgi:WXG100 family type VII secretion target
MLQMVPEDLLRLRSVFDNQATEVTTLQGTIQSAIDGTVWESPAATEFRNLWQGEFVPALNNLREALSRAAAGVQNSHDKVVDANRAI